MTETVASRPNDDAYNGHLSGTPVGPALRALLRADTVVLLHNRITVVLSILLPLVILVVTTVGNAPTRLGRPEQVVALALTLGLITSCLLGYSLGLAHDRELGVLQRLRVTPVRTWTIMTSRLLVQIATNLVASLVVVVVGAILHGLSPNLGQYLLVLAVAVLGAGVFLALGQALVGLVKTTNAINAVGRLLFIVLIILGLVGGAGVLGPTVQTVANWSPVGALMTLFTAVLTGAAWTGNDAVALIACAAYVVIFTYIGIRWFRWQSH